MADVAQDSAIQCTSLTLQMGATPQQQVAAYTNVKLLHDDSGALLPAYVVAFHELALFWLDGHYCDGTSAKGDVETCRTPRDFDFTH